MILLPDPIFRIFAASWSSSGEQQLGAFPASTRSRWRQDPLQAQPQIFQRTKGCDGCGPCLSEGMQCITWNTRGLVGSVVSKQKNREFKLKYLKRLFDANNILCLQEVHEISIQAIQVLAPRFRLFGTFIPDIENAGGSAICMHRHLLPEDAIVTHLITCQGRDHLVNIQSGHNLVNVNVHFEPELTLRQLRGRLRLIHPHWTFYVSKRCMERMSIFRLFRYWLRDFVFWVLSFLGTKTQEDRPSASARNFCLRMPL